ncbi:MAG: aminotransferase class I/II-fold pyridoxal phosphate-dependent enzyme [archaeon]
MGKSNFIKILKSELERIDSSKTQKRFETVIEGFDPNDNKRAMIKGKNYLIFNSNDYLGLRFNEKVRLAEEKASQKYGSGPGAVRFISGTMKVHRELEKELAKFHGREDAVIFSSAFAVNVGVIHSLIKGQSKDSKVSGDTLVVSDEINHRSIIDSIRIAGLSKENKVIFKHLDMDNLREVLEENKGKFKRVILVSDGVFSMLGEYQDLKKLQTIADEFDSHYEEGVITVIDDSHGVGSFGKHGRGCEDVCNAKCDVLIGTLGKGFGVDGGYVVGEKIVMDYIRESAATYIYSNPIAPGTAGAALASVKLVNSPEGKELIQKLNKNIAVFKEKMLAEGFTFAADSIHGIQPVLIGDAVKTRALTDSLFEKGVIVTNISYPVVPPGKDEIRVQISAAHTKDEIDEFVEKCTLSAKEVGIL